MFDSSIVVSQLIQWISDYFEKNAAPDTKAVIGISGGKDSSVAAALCVRALGAGRVFGVLMPQGRQDDIDVAYGLCTHLAIPFVEINIKDSVDNLYAQIERTGLKLNSVAEFNTPARIRMTALYAVSGIVGGRVVNTCNLSEDWVGYSTKFGDSAGDFSPLSNLTVSEVKAVGRELGLPARFIDKVPIDGLSGQTDEDNLRFSYDVLDRYIRRGICEDAEAKAKIDKMHEINAHKVLPMPAFKI